MKNTFFTFLTIFLALMPIVLLAQAPDLKSCASFVLFTPDGALANTGGFTHITGNIGTALGAISGYPVGSVLGNEHNDDVMTDSATVHVQKVYNYLLALPCTGASLAPTMGTNQTLTPATYCQAGAASVTGDLILDGQNQVDPLFIFKVNGAFSTGAGARVLLINGAKASNVYWQVGGAASFAASSVLVGNIIAYGAISFGDGVSLYGRGLSTVGAVSTYNNSISSTEAPPLPVELTDFTARMQSGTAVALAWRTASEKNTARFEVECSATGAAFNRIGAVPAAGNSSTPHTYSWTAEMLPAQAGPVYYRLRQVDADGTATYSPVRSASRILVAKYNLAVYPNPSHDVVHVQVLGSVLTEQLQLLDASGRTLQVHPAGVDGIPLTGLPAGLYMLRCGPLAQRLTLE